MKKQFLILIIMLFGIICLIKADSTTVGASSQKVEATGGNAEIEALKLKVELLEKHESWVLTLFGFGLTGTAILLGLLQFYFSKKAEDNVLTNLSKIANEDKEAFKEAVRMKSIEIELMSYPIYIVYDTAKEKTMAEDLYKLLSAYRMANVKKPVSYEGALSEKFDEKTVLIFCEDSYNPAGCSLLIDRNPAIGVLGFGQFNKEKFSLPPHRCLNYANSLSSVYGNLMSLLHYKRYLLSVRY